MSVNLSDRSCYGEACSAWPKVGWPKAAFECHLELIAGGSCSHPIDFFLSGAAGFWVEGAWDIVTHETRSASLAYLTRYRDIDETVREDCYTTVVGRLLRIDDRLDTAEFQAMGFTKPPCTIVQFNGSSRLSTYVISGVENEMRSNLRRKTKSTKPRSLGERAEQLGAGDQSPGLGCPRELELLEQGLRESLSEFNNEDRLLFLLVLERGMTRKAAARFLDWPDPVKATRRIQKLGEVVSSVIDRVTETGADGSDRLSVQVWGRILSRVMQDFDPSSSNSMDKPVSGLFKPLSKRSLSK